MTPAFCTRIARFGLVPYPSTDGQEHRIDDSTGLVLFVIVSPSKILFFNSASVVSIRRSSLNDSIQIVSATNTNDSLDEKIPATPVYISVSGEVADDCVNQIHRKQISVNMTNYETIWSTRVQ